MYVVRETPCTAARRGEPQGVQGGVRAAALAAAYAPRPRRAAPRRGRSPRSSAESVLLCVGGTPASATVAVAAAVNVAAAAAATVATTPIALAKGWTAAVAAVIAAAAAAAGSMWIRRGSGHRVHGQCMSIRRGTHRFQGQCIPRRIRCRMRIRRRIITLIGRCFAAATVRDGVILRSTHRLLAVDKYSILKGAATTCRE